MRRRMRHGAILAAAALLVATACEREDEEQGSQDQTQEQAQQAESEETPLEVARAHSKPFGQLPEDWAREGQTKAQEDLGRMLFYEERLSKNHDVSCNSCHKLTNFGVDNEATSLGHKEVRGPRNSPTVYNAAGHVAQFWDGRAADVEEQAKGPVTNPKEMAMPDEDYVLEVLNSIPGYLTAFEEAFPEDEDPITFENMARAIGAFERKLSTPARWDEFLAGDDEALTTAELEGFHTFVEVGCQTCHNGALVGGTTYQKVGAIKAWPNQKDQGRFEVTGEDADRMMFKTPSLRNVTETHPYFHDGGTETLEEAVRMMAEYQLGQDLSDEQVTGIVTWLGSLKGELPTEYIAKPELPESGPETPAPDPG